jgi:serralysin
MSINSWLPGKSTTAAFTNVQNVDAVIFGAKWDGPITYSFPANSSDYWGSPSELSAGTFFQITFEQMQAARYILEGTSPLGGGPRMSMMAVEQFTMLDITYAGTSPANLMFGSSDGLGSRAYAYLPNGHSASGDIWFGTEGDWSAVTPGTYDYKTMLHEIGHALGLKHGHDAGYGGVALTPDADSPEMSVMTYHTIPGLTQIISGGDHNSPQTYMMYDIAALQHLYGANFATNSGDTRYQWNAQTGETLINGVGQGSPSANRIFLTLWDGGGIDTYDLTNYASDLNVDLRPGGWSVFSRDQLAYLGYDFVTGRGDVYSRGNVFNALLYQDDPRSLIENVVGGSGHDVITGNITDNVLSGNLGDDTLQGGAGDDILNGGRGDDVIDGGTGVNVAVVSGSRSNFIVAVNTDKSFTLVDQRAGGDGTDVVKNVAHIVFTDGAFTLNADTGPASLELSHASVSEDAAINTVVGTLLGDGIVYSLMSNPGGNFRLEGSQIVLDKGLDYEQTPAHSITVASTTASGMSLIKTFMISVTDVYEPPVLPPPPDVPVTPIENPQIPVEPVITNKILYGSPGRDLLVGGAGNDLLYGYNNNDTMIGDPGDDTLIGGSGNDRLTGGPGRDIFVFDAKLGTAKTDRKVNFDTLTDFNVSDDTIWLDNKYFTKLGNGSQTKPTKLNKKFFVVGDKAKDLNDYVIYNKKTGILSYDRDGSRSAEAIEIAKLAKNLKLAYSDFFVI